VATEPGEPGTDSTRSSVPSWPGRELHVGDATLPVDLLIAAHELGIARCVVGMDLLHGTVLAVVGPPGSPVRWLLP
jgi:hypothetical protein